MMQIRSAFVLQLALAAALTWAQMTTENPISNNDCESQYPGVNISVVEENIENPSNDVKCFMKCELEDQRIMDENGHLNDTVVIGMFENENYEPEFWNELKKCIAIDDPDLCNKAYVFYNCVLEAIRKFEPSGTTMASLVNDI
ncbi:General odorant-binding protein 19a [Gryllus bimaculatus]|nr:General odorant-binding protein 19a [Gryllus bimaculatus]